MPQQDGQATRSAATQNALMRAAEKLVAEKGIAKISIREIVKVAGQKNESALQYHFGNLQGLIDAIKASRNQEIHAMRAWLMEQSPPAEAGGSLRYLCYLMVAPTFLLARKVPAFRLFILGFSHELALTPESAFARASRQGGGGASGQKLGELLRARLNHLDDNAFRQRMDSAVRLAAISMGHHARQKSAFRGAAADYFLQSLIDAIVGLLDAPVSEETKAVSSGPR